MPIDVLPAPGHVAACQATCGGGGSSAPYFVKSCQVLTSPTTHDVCTIPGYEGVLGNAEHRCHRQTYSSCPSDRDINLHLVSSAATQRQTPYSWHPDASTAYILKFRCSQYRQTGLIAQAVFYHTPQMFLAGQINIGLSKSQTANSIAIVHARVAAGSCGPYAFASSVLCRKDRVYLK